MNKFPLPLGLPAGVKPIITQPYGVTNNTIEPEGPNGQPHFHYGIDIVLGNDHATYGAHLFCPFPTAAAYVGIAPLPGSSQSSYLTLTYTASDGTQYECVLVHVSEVEKPESFVYGNHVANIGNQGLVNPKPDLQDPYKGAHLHLALKINHQFVDPALHFDMTKWFDGDRPNQQDALPATNWLIGQLMHLLGINGSTNKGV